MSDKRKIDKEIEEKINEIYANSPWGKDGTTTEERASSSYSKDKK